MRKMVSSLLAAMGGLGVIAVAASPINAATNYTFATIDVPGAIGSSEAQGINNAGQIVGSFGDQAGVHGYLDISGNFTTIDVPGASSTEALGTNNAGQIVGDTTNPGGRPLFSPVGHGFFYSAGSLPPSTFPAHSVQPPLA
jgi:hypothetical protein